MNNFFQKINQSIKKPLVIKSLFAVFLFTLVIKAQSVGLFPEALAAPTEQLQYSTKDFLSHVVGVVTSLFKVIQQLLWPVLLLTGPLLDNSLIYGPGIEDRLFDIWVQFRNLTNLLVAILLIGVTLYNLLGIGEGSSYELKSFFKKMVIALVAINFSFFGARLILDATNVATVFAFSLPNTVQSHSAEAIGRLEDSICSTMQDIGAGAVQDTLEGFTSFGLIGSDSEGFCNGASLTSSAKAFFSRVSASNLSMIMAGNYANIAEGLRASRTLEVSLDITNMTINAILSLLIILMHGAAYLSLFFVLVARIIFLWLAISISPLVVFASIMGISAFDDLSKLLDEFFTHAIAPAKIGFAMSISYIIFSAIEKNGLSAQGASLGGALVYPFSGISTLEQFLVTIGAAVVVYDVALEVGSNTKAGFITNSIKSFTRDQLNTGQAIFKKIPLGAGSTGPITLGSLTGNLGNMQKAIQGYGDSSNKGEDKIIQGMKSGRKNFITQKDFIEMTKQPKGTYANLNTIQLREAFEKNHASWKWTSLSSEEAKYRKIVAELVSSKTLNQTDSSW